MFSPNYLSSIYLPLKVTDVLYTNYNNCYLALYTEIFLIIGLCILITYLVILDYLFKYEFILSKLALNLTVFILFLLLLLNNNSTSNFFVFDYLLIQDNFAVFIKNIVLVSLISSILLSINYIKTEKIYQYEYFLLIGLALLGILTMISSNDLITMYLAIELQSLSFYILAAFKVHNNFSTEAGLKYFILGAFSSGLLLFGCSLIYGFCGTTNLYDLQLLFVNKEIPNDIF